MRLLIVSDSEQQVHHLLLDILSQTHELAVDAVKYGLEVVPFAGIFAIEEFDKRFDELRRDVVSDHLVVEVDRHYEF